MQFQNLSQFTDQEPNHRKGNQMPLRKDKFSFNLSTKGSVPITRLNLAWGKTRILFSECLNVVGYGIQMDVDNSVL